MESCLEIERDKDRRGGGKRRMKREIGVRHTLRGGEAGKGPRVKGAKGKKDKDWLEIFCNVEKI